MAKTILEKETAKLKREVVKLEKNVKENMLSVGTYRMEFDRTVKTYAELKCQYNTLNKDFMEKGSTVVEEYTNKNGSTNIRKTATYMILEMLRKDILIFENTLGLTPAGLKKINKIIGIKKKSVLGEALKNLE